MKFCWCSDCDWVGSSTELICFILCPNCGSARIKRRIRLKEEYPSDRDLEIIEHWDVMKCGVDGLLEYIKNIWWLPDWGFKLIGKKILWLELHTGGWSGNEDIIEALKKNEYFWAIYWIKSLRGGHYYFKISNFRNGVVRSDRKK